MSGHMRPLDPMEMVVLGLLCACSVVFLVAVCLDIYQRLRGRK